MALRLQALADTLVLGALLDDLRQQGGYELVDHWKQGEFHHDVVVRLPDSTVSPASPAPAARLEKADSL